MEDNNILLSEAKLGNQVNAKGQRPKLDNILGSYFHMGQGLVKTTNKMF